MFLDVVSLLVGFLCLFVVLLMIFNQKPNRKTNGYLITILVVVGLQRFLYAIEALGLTNITYSPLKIKPLLAFYIVPVYYLFFRRLIDGKRDFKKEVLHFIFPSLLILFSIINTDYAINHLFYLGYSVLYFVFILVSIKKFIHRKNPSIIDKTSYQSIKSWLFIMTIMTLLLIIYSNCLAFQDLTYQMNLDDFYRYSSLVWFSLVLYMFKNPVIIFGEHALLKNIHLNAPQDFETWSRKPLKLVNDKDRKVYNTILNRVESIILEIQTLQKSPDLLSQTSLTTETLAKELKIPKRHIDFIFKYYCHYSINDFSNLVKVNYALSLIKGGYLDKFTVDSLGKKCLFNSRFTFSKNFKKFVGVSVSDFGNSHNALA